MLVGMAEPKGHSCEHGKQSQRVTEGVCGDAAAVDGMRKALRSSAGIACATATTREKK